MSTVYSRTFRSTPFRSAQETWASIIDLLTQGRDDEKRAELTSVSGIAASLISDQSPASAPIVVTCNGPRTRIYCLYGDASIEDEGNEAALGFEPLGGDWAVSFPCPADDLTWVQNALKAKSSRITARDSTETCTNADKTAAQGNLTLDIKGFLAS